MIVVFHVFPGNCSVLSPLLFLFYAENTLWHYDPMMVCFGRGNVGRAVLARSQFRNWVIAFSYLSFLMRLLKLSSVGWPNLFYMHSTPKVAALPREASNSDFYWHCWKILLHPGFPKNPWGWNVLHRHKLLGTKVGLRGVCFSLLSSVRCCWRWAAFVTASLSQRQEEPGWRTDPGDVYCWVWAGLLTSRISAANICGIVDADSIFIDFFFLIFRKKMLVSVFNSLTSIVFYCNLKYT